MTDIVWEDPPATKGRTRGNVDWNSFVAALRAHPGKWAIAQTREKSGGLGPLRSRLIDRYGCEATQRTNADGTFTLFARWPDEVQS